MCAYFVFLGMALEKKFFKEINSILEKNGIDKIILSEDIKAFIPKNQEIDYFPPHPIDWKRQNLKNFSSSTRKIINEIDIFIYCCPKSIEDPILFLSPEYFKALEIFIVKGVYKGIKVREIEGVPENYMFITTAENFNGW
ncbi:MAG TPA: hypothetical protein PKH16_09965 [Aequorivita sp.]|nr:hypothetical protein [Aequorivita sp.]